MSLVPMHKRPLVLALGGGQEFSDNQKDYSHLKDIATVKWIHKSNDWASSIENFVKEEGHPLCVLLYGAQIKSIGEEPLSSLLPDLRLLASQGAGYDNIDIDWCTRNGIWVSNTPNSVTDATANSAVWLTLSALRELCVSYDAAKDGQWRGEIKMTECRDPMGLKFGVVGLGRIGSLVAKRMRCFGVEVYYHSRHRADEETEREAGDASYMEKFEDLLKLCDVVSVHVPLSSGTKHLFNAEAFKAMKKDSIFINTARGAIHDEQALIAALDAGHLRGAGLDVFEREPIISPEFLRDGRLSKRVVTTGHIGAFTIQTHTHMQKEILRNVIAVLETDRPKNPVNEPKSK